MAVLFLIPQTAHGQVQSGAAFLKILPGARQQGFASSLTAGLDESYAIYANPGGIGFYREWQWSAGYTEWIADIFNTSLIYGRQVPFKNPLSDRVHVAIGLQYQGVREFDSSRGADAPASANDFLITGSVGSPVNPISPNLAWGVTLKYFRSELAQFTEGSFIFDFGLLYKTPRIRLHKTRRGFFEYGYLSAGVSASQLGQPMKFIAAETPLPRTLRAGLALNLGAHDGLQIQLAGDYRATRDENGRFGFGAEITNLFSPINKNIGRFVDIRGGYNFDGNLLSKLSLGVSVKLDDYTTLPVKNITPENSALRLDLGAVDNNEFFSSVYRGSVSHYSIRPEKFEFVRTDSTVFPETGPVAVSWKVSRDPDLYDDVDYVLLLSLQDSLGLANFVEDIKTKRFDIYKSFDSTHKEGEEDKTKIDVLDLNQPQITANFTIDTRDIILNPVETTYIEKKSEQIDFTFSHTLQPGKHYWAVMAYDRNRHNRFAKKSGSHIQSFDIKSVIKPDLTITMTPKIIAESLDPIELNLEPIRFKADSAAVAVENKNLLLSWIKIIKQTPDVVFEIAGHADRTGPGPAEHRTAYNQKLSALRAERIVNYLILNGINSARVIANGYGESELLDPGRKLAAHQKNRRVEIRVSRDYRNPVTRPCARVTFSNLGQRVAQDVAVSIFDLADLNHTALFNELKDGKFHSLNTGQNGVVLEHPRLLEHMTIAQILPNDSTSIDVPYEFQRPYILAVIDSDNLIDESDEFNNWNMQKLFTPAPKMNFPVVDPNMVNFEFNSFELTQATQKGLSRISDFLKENSDLSLDIIGHTDSRGSENYNLVLSQRRAESVRNYFIACGISEDRLFAQGMGEANPLDPSNTAAAWQVNRRVEIKPVIAEKTTQK